MNVVVAPARLVLCVKNESFVFLNNYFYIITRYYSVSLN